MWRSRVLLLAVATAFALSLTPAWAGTVIDFTTGSAGVGGSITRAADMTNLIGSGIPIGNMTVNLTDDYDVDAHLRFSTGGALGNYFRIEGTVAVGESVISGELLHGTIANFALPCCGRTPVLFTASGSDSKHSGLLLALGLSPDTAWDFFGLSLQLPGWVLGQTSSAVVWSAVRNTSSSVTSVPEASSLLLFGSALGGLGFLVTRYWGERLRN
jgi:hypothetical protein